VNENIIRQSWLEARSQSRAEAIKSKDSQMALKLLAQRYRHLTEGERLVIDQLLGDQLASNDESLRFDSEALIREFRIVSAIPALRALSARLEGMNSPGAPYEWAKVGRLIALLNALPSSGDC
jgi:hypothetical protein